MVRFLTLVFVGIIVLMLVSGGTKGPGVTLAKNVTDDGSFFIDTLLGG